MKELISIDLYFRDYITKADRRVQFASEFTPDINNNAIKLLGLINQLLNDLGIESADVTSGWRPPQINNKTTNAAKRSYHMMGLACDILDDENQTLAKLVASRPDLLKKYGLWLESPDSTKGINTNWAHLDLGTRQDRPSRVFLP
jgi:hypothetical protein